MNCLSKLQNQNSKNTPRWICGRVVLWNVSFLKRLRCERHVNISYSRINIQVSIFFFHKKYESIIANWMKQPTSWQPVPRIKWRHDVIFRRDIMTLYLCTKTVTIPSRGPPNLSNFLFERQWTQCWESTYSPLDGKSAPHAEPSGWVVVKWNYISHVHIFKHFITLSKYLFYCLLLYSLKVTIKYLPCMLPVVHVSSWTYTTGVMIWTDPFGTFMLLL